MHALCLENASVTPQMVVNFIFEGMSNGSMEVDRNELVTKFKGSRSCKGFKNSI